MLSVDIKRHWAVVRSMGCCISQTEYNVTIHHCHGGSIRQTFGEAAMPGMARRQHHWLVIPIAAKYHVGDFGLDSSIGIFDWEDLFGSQLNHLCWVNDRLPYDLFEKAGLKHTY